MPVFKYRAIDDNGKIHNGTIDAAGAGDLEARLRKTGMDLISHKERKVGSRLGQTISRKDMINFCFHLEQLVNSGVPIIEGLADLRESEEKGGFRDVIAGVNEGIEGGLSFSDALKKYPGVFDEVFVSLMRVGEKSGQMGAVLKDVTDTLKWQDELISKTKKVMAYPIGVGILITIITGVLMIFVVPDLMVSIVSLGGTIPWYSRALMAVSDAVIAYWYLMLSIPVALVFGVKHLNKKNKKFRYKFDSFMINLPIFGIISQKIKLARFARYFALTYASGITVLDAIEMLKKVMGNAVLEGALDTVYEQISEGSTISDSFRNVGVFPPLVVRMLRIGEAGGGIDKSLRNIAYFYERDVDDAIDKMQPAVELGMIVILGGIVLWLIVSVLGPVYDTMGTVGAL